jgi:nitroreductase
MQFYMNILLIALEDCVTSFKDSILAVTTTVFFGALCIAGWRMIDGSRLKMKQKYVGPAPLLQCITQRRSVFANNWIDRAVPEASLKRLLEAAMWAPYHGPVPPWRFVVLGRKSIVEMQSMTLAFYDAHWRDVGWACSKHGEEEDYLKWRKTTVDEITSRWGPVSYFVAIIMRRQAGSKRISEWEEAAATACAVQNMHLQASTDPGLACYWSSWHDAARESDEMRHFLGMATEDRCMGFFVVAACDPTLKSRRTRQPGTHLSVEWRQ